MNIRSDDRDSIGYEFFVPKNVSIHPFSLTLHHIIENIFEKANGGHFEVAFDISRLLNQKTNIINEFPAQNNPKGHIQSRNVPQTMKNSPLT